MIEVDVLIEQIRRILTNDIPESGLLPTVREILVHVRQGLAVAMKDSFYEGSKFDDVLYANDQYNFNFTGVSVQTAQDYKFITLPSIPIELPRGRGIVSIRPSGSIRNAYTPIQRKDLDVMLLHTRNKKRKQVVFFQEGNLVKLIQFGGAPIAPSLDGTIVTPGTIELGSVLLVSDDIQAKIIDYVLSVLGKSKQKVDDQNTDGINAA